MPASIFLWHLNPHWGEARPVVETAVLAAVRDGQQMQQRYASDGRGTQTEKARRDTEVRQRRGNWDPSRAAREGNLRRLEAALAKFIRSPEQRYMHEQMVRRSMLQLVKKPTRALLREYNMTADPGDAQLAIITPRQFGKTYAMGQMLAALLITQEEANILCIAYQLQMTRNLLADVPKRASELDENWMRRCVRLSTDRIQVWGHGNTSHDPRRVVTISVKAGTSKITGDTSQSVSRRVRCAAVVVVCAVCGTSA